ncbi:MAG: transglutaminase domain-containing protein [Oscillospiraceae bacterium]
MTKDMFSDGVLVYDRYYCSKPRTPLLVIKRVLLTAFFCVSSMLFILNEYGFQVNLPLMAVVCAVSCTAFSALFIFVKKRFALPALFLAASAAVGVCFEPLTERLSYFADGFMLLVEGRFLYPRRFLFHPGEVLDAANPDYIAGLTLGTILLCILYSLITAICFTGRTAPVPAILLMIVLCVPVLISERLEFSLWLIPALATFAGLCAIRKNYSGGLAMKHGTSSDYRRRIRQEEKTFMKRISSAPFAKRLEMRCNYYSKYFSVGIYAAALVAVCLIIGASVIPEGGSIDYTSLYDIITSFGSESGVSQSPFEEGTASEYFSQNGSQQHDQLNIISPGRGEREIIRVSYTGDRPVYLRGDIGIDFNGTSWTTAVGDEPLLWTSTGLKNSYRPCESRVIAALLSAAESDGEVYGSDGEQIITASDVTIEYLCSTNVVFLPPYTAEYSFYNNDSFDVYADYAVRVSEQAGSHVNSVHCTALLPSYMSNETYTGDPSGFAAVEQVFENSLCMPNDIYSSVLPEMTEADILADYEDYVNATYLNIPYNCDRDISEYIQRTMSTELGALQDIRLSDDISEAQYRYAAASYVAEYLRSNYTYSLDGSNNSRNPVMQFLNDTRRGHCSLYASAMTLILRQIGIPARYCTGFYVESADGSNSVLLKEKNLHAWVEVYTGQYGWVTFDPTSSSAYPGRNTDTPAVTTDESPKHDKPESRPTVEHRPPVLPSERETMEHSVQTAHETSEAAVQPGNTGFWDIIRVIAPVVLVIAAVTALGAVLLTRLNRLKRNARRSLDFLKTGGSTDCARMIYRLILVLLEQCGLTPGRGELPTDFWRRADGQLGTSLSESADILAAMEFGEHEVTDEERASVYRELETIIAKIKPFDFPGNLNVLRMISNITKIS